jgi:hypothetical protein
MNQEEEFVVADLEDSGEYPKSIDLDDPDPEWERHLDECGGCPLCNPTGYPDWDGCPP